ncbi:uncharacterized protein UHO2_00288 [Ustilago hordei]|uniref:Uncharacterized protein n=1 Tax=Ustilago hordei TaxID=120017 RepID=I2FY05_USTHO|nr:uncharacterized protein UHO2_00288 [Ustilago hordei]KAJ1587497.1 hypothetical protein NDA15_006062 [Ustilago hordei]KAJ1589828.1 hypothetical protein NDA12_001345 [Ustilago hordei]CCF51798.1 uncharacterized protein UHOR_03825 [Ustilago hordei]SYW81783.1 uncharacterized protein UHO2_00288 [Ustilago hordei]
MSTLEGAVPLGLGITKLRLWDELNQAHCEALQQSNSISASSSTFTQLSPTLSDKTAPLGPQHVQPPDKQSIEVLSERSHESDATLARRKKLRRSSVESVSEGSAAVDSEPERSYQTSCFDWLLTSRDSGCRLAANASNGNVSQNKRDSYLPARDGQGVLMPPPPPKPGPSRRKPPPLIVRIKAKARRAKRKQQKAEYRRCLFLAHMVQATQAARLQNAPMSKSTQKPTYGAHEGACAKLQKPTTKPRLPAEQRGRQAPSTFPETLGVDLASFVEVVFDTDVQSSEITAPSDISDDDLARATKMEIETRKKLGGADVVVPKGVFRWMVGRDFAERWPQKVKGVRKNPWPGLENVWGSPSGMTTIEGLRGEGKDQVKRDEEPFRWQSGQRSRFIRRKEKVASQTSSRIGPTLKEVRAAVGIGHDAISELPALAIATAAIEVTPTVSASAVHQSVVKPALSPARSTTLRPTEQDASPIVPEIFPSGLVPSSQPLTLSSQSLTLSSQPSRASHPYDMSDTFATSWDWSSAFTYSRSTALPSTLAGVPISL